MIEGTILKSFRKTIAFLHLKNLEVQVPMHFKMSYAFPSSSRMQNGINDINLSTNAVHKLMLNRLLVNHRQQHVLSTHFFGHTLALPSAPSLTSMDSVLRGLAYDCLLHNKTHCIESTIATHQQQSSIAQQLSESLMSGSQLAIKGERPSISPLASLYVARQFEHLISTAPASSNYLFINNLSSNLTSATNPTGISAYSFPTTMLNSQDVPLMGLQQTAEGYNMNHIPAKELQTAAANTKPAVFKLNTVGAHVLSKRNISSNVSSTNNSTHFHENISGQSPVELYRPIDSDVLSEYQCFVRKHIEFFEATEDDVSSNAKGRNKPVVLGQVGIRCRHCACIPPKYRSRGAMYYPTKLHLIYQAAQNMVKTHLHLGCQNVPETTKYTLSKLRKSKCAVGGGKSYWEEGASALNVYEATDGCLRFRRLNNNTIIVNSNVEILIPTSSTIARN
jgi:hypothetical protein